MYNGKPIHYKNLELLAKKLNISRAMASKLIKDDGRRIIKQETGEVEIINIKKDNPRGLLSKDFNIKRATNKNLINGHFYPTKKVEILKELGPEEEDKGLHINIQMYVNFSSPEIVTTYDVLNKKGKNLFEKKMNLIGYHKDGKSFVKDGEIFNVDQYYKLLDSKIIKCIDILNDKKALNYYLDDGSISLKKKHYVFSGLQKDIEKFVQDKIDKYVGTIGKNFARITYYNFWVGSTYQNKKLKFEDGYIRDFENEYVLTEWTNIQYNYKNKNGDSCAVSYIGKRFPELYWDIKILEDENGITLNNFMIFCRINSISYYLYNELGKETHRFEGNKGKIYCIIYNNHIYPLLGGKPKKYNCKEYNVHLLENSHEIYEKILNKKNLPSKIKICDIVSFTQKKGGEKNIDITSFIVKDDKYIFNPSYEKCLNILKKMGHENYIFDNIKITDISKILEKIYKVSSTASFFPKKYLFKTAPLYYKSDIDIKCKKLSNIDKNKAYPYCLYNLPYLIVFDWRKYKVNKNPKKIIEEFLYLVKPHKWSIPLPAIKLYAGYHLLECKKLGLEFDLLEELETITVPNYYRKIIKIMFENMDEIDFKKAMVILIGKFERDIREEYHYKYINTCNKESSLMYDGFTQKIGNHTIFFKEQLQYKYARDKLPIATQVKDMSRLMITKKIQELKIEDEDIFQINTDSISYLGELPNDLDKKSFDGWKEIEYKDIGCVLSSFDIYGGRCVELDDDEELSLLSLKNNNPGITKLYMNYAGTGKTTKIIKKIVPKAKKMSDKEDDYIVLTPTHSTLDELKKFGVKCEIAHKYTFSDTVPKEKTIIFDEIGFADLSCHDLLYKLNDLNKNIIAFGDFNQMQPIGEDRPCNQLHYLEFLFKKINTRFTNHRNNFTKEYYDKLINNEIDIVKEVNKYSTSINKAEVILCYRTNKSTKFKTRDEYNKKILKKIGKSSSDIGVKLICIDNSLIKDEIYHHKQVIIKDKYKENEDDKYFTYKLEDNNKKEYIIKEKQLKHFRPAYAINIYEAQGSTLNSYHWAEEDNKFLNGNMAYTIISRLRGDVYKK